MDIKSKKEMKIRLIEEFYQEYGRLPSVREKYKEVAIGKFLIRIRQGKTKITEDQMNRLLKLGFDIKVKDKEKEKEDKIKLVEEFYREKGRLPRQEEKYKEVATGKFLTRIKQGKTKITEDQVNRLLKLGFDIKIKDKEEEKENKIKLVEEFYRKNGRLPKQKEKYKEVAIGQFLTSIKQGNTKITEDQMNRLLKLGFEGQTNDIRVDESIFKIGQFYRKNKRLPEPGESFRNEKKKIGDVLLSIRIGKVRITESQFFRLQQMDATLTREQVRFLEKPKTHIKNR